VENDKLWKNSESPAVMSMKCKEGIEGTRNRNGLETEKYSSESNPDD
jgi:hypothetical protein